MSRSDLNYPVGLCTVPPPPQIPPRRSHGGMYDDMYDMYEDDLYEEMYRYRRLPREKPKPVALKSVKIDTTIDGFVSDVTTTLKYHNEESSPIEAKFVMPIDISSAVYYFEAKLDGRTVVGECQDKNQARETYRDAQEAGHTAFLMEQDRKNKDVFEVAVGNLAGKKDCTVTFRYVRQLEVNPEGGVAYTAPLVIPKRYTPPEEQKEEEAEDKPVPVQADSSAASNPGYFAKMKNKLGWGDFQSRLTSMQAKFGMGKFGLEHAPGTTKAPYTLEFYGRIRTLNSLVRLESASKKDEFRLDVMDATETRVALKNPFDFDHDLSFTLYFDKPFNPQVFFEPGVDLRAQDEEKQKFISYSAAMVNLFPKLKDSDFTANHEFIFIVDRSGSMMGTRIKSAKEALLLFLKSLPAGCFFNIIGFGTNYEVLFPDGSREYTEESLKEALDYQEGMEANMASTNILDPLTYVYSKPVKESFARKLLVLTDGGVGNTKKVVELVAGNCDNTRVFTFGIGEGASSALVKGMARSGLGKYEFVLGEERLQSKVMQVLMCAMQDSVTDLHTIWKLPGADEVINIPEKLPSLYSGDKLVQYAIFPHKKSQMANNQSISVVLKGKIGDRDLEYEVPVKVVKCEPDAQRAFPIHRLTAREQIQFYEDQLDNNMVSNRYELVQKMTQFSIAANIASSQTSFVGVDKEQRERVEILQRPVPHMMDADPMMMMMMGHPMAGPPMGRRRRERASRAAGMDPYAQIMNMMPSMSGLRSMLGGSRSRQSPDSYPAARGSYAQPRSSMDIYDSVDSMSVSRSASSRSHSSSNTYAPPPRANTASSAPPRKLTKPDAPPPKRATPAVPAAPAKPAAPAAPAVPAGPPPRINYRTQRQTYTQPGLEQTDGPDDSYHDYAGQPVKLAPGVRVVTPPPRRLRQPRSRKNSDEAKSAATPVVEVKMEVDPPASNEPPRVPPISKVTVECDGPSRAPVQSDRPSRMDSHVETDSIDMLEYDGCEEHDGEVDYRIRRPPPPKVIKPPIAVVQPAKPPIRKDASEPGSLSALVKLQKFNGSWFLDDDLARVLKKSVNELYKPAPFKDDAIWGTSLIISYLRKFLPDIRVEWELIEKKALDWLRKQDLQGHTVGDLLLAVRKGLKW